MVCEGKYWSTGDAFVVRFVLRRPLLKREEFPLLGSWHLPLTLPNKHFAVGVRHKRLQAFSLTALLVDDGKQSTGIVSKMGVCCGTLHLFFLSNKDRAGRHGQYS